MVGRKGDFFIFTKEFPSRKLLIMTNIQQKKTDPLVVTRIRSLNEETVLKALSELRYSGSAAYLPVLADVLMQTGFKEVRRSIQSVLGELKDPAAIPVIMEIIEDEQFLPVRKDVMAACWQNGLDFSPYLSRFVDWVIDNEMDIAFEAFTVIENLDQLPAAEIREAEIRKINQALQNADNLKTYLLKELRSILA